MKYQEQKKSKQQRRDDNMRAAIKANNKKQILSALPWIIFITLTLAGFILLVRTLSVPPQGELIEAQGSPQHISNGEAHGAYSTNPPTSGDHQAIAAKWGVYDWTLKDEQAVHNLEHGGIWISYKDIDDETLTELQDFANKHPQSVILSPREKNDRKIAITAWERLLEMDTFDLEQLELFYKGNKNNSPEPLAGK